MNIHPLFVHFPIAFLTIYAVIELLSTTALLQRQRWLLGTKQFLLFVGTVAAFVTLQTGELAEHALGDRSLAPLVETHAFFASAATYLFLGLSLIYLFQWAHSRAWFESRVPLFLKKITTLYSKIFDHRAVIVLGALAGIVTIVITGALGGAIVYGPSVDPIVSLVYGLFF